MARNTSLQEATTLLQRAVASTSSADPAIALLDHLLLTNPSLVQPLWSTITTIVADHRPAHLANWAANLARASLCTPSRGLGPEVRNPLALQSLGAVARLVADPDVALQKLGLQILATIYPQLFKHTCTINDQRFWASVVSLKTAALQLWRTGATGAKTAAVKVLQRIIQTQTRGTADPRLQRTAEPSLSLCRPGHPFLKIAQLEEEANTILEECITTLFTSQSPDVVAAVTTALNNLVKTRPAFATLIITAFSNWTPATLTGCSSTQVRSVEKTVRVSLTHLLKTAHANAFASQVTEFLNRQSVRMEQAANEARQQREQEASRKRQLLTEQVEGSSTKRRRLDSPSPLDPTRIFAPVFDNGPPPPPIDVSALPPALVVDLVVTSLEALEEARFAHAISTARRRIPPSEITSPSPQLEDADAPARQEAYIKAEPVDPLKLDLGDEELAMKAEVIPDVESDDESEVGDNQVVEFDPVADSVDLLTPKAISANTKTSMIQSAIRRICAAGTEGAASSIWVPLVARLITRGLTIESDELADELDADNERGEALRSVMFDFVVADLQSRMEFARLWLNEEWYVASRSRSARTLADRPYDRWLRRLLEHIITFSSNKDKAFTQFMIDLPEIPREEIARLGEMCLNPDQVQLGFSALRELATLRPPAREAALDVLLSLTTHADKLTRNAAIMTVKRWVPDITPLSTPVIAFALSLYKRLTVAPSPIPAAADANSEGAADKVGDEEGEEDMKMDATPPPEPPKSLYARVQHGEVVDGLNPPTTPSEVVQHVELLLALCVKEPDLLMPLFEGYGELQPVAKESLQDLIAPLIRSLGLKHPKILEAVERFSPGSDDLMLRTLNILADKSRLPTNVINLVRGVATRQELGPRFYVMILGDCDKAEIIRYLPRIVTLLNNTPEEKTVVRSAFMSATAPPSQFAGATGSIRIRTDLITPVELMVLLHKSEKETGLKSTIEAISICFSMPDAFRPEVLAAFMQQIVEEPVLPVLFMRTVIQAVTTYKSLQAFVSTTLLSRLIAKKVWETGPLWEGFIRCAKAIVPNSFPALLQLPKEQLKDVVTRQPTLRLPLREYVEKKMVGSVGPNKLKSESLLEVLGVDDENAAVTGDFGVEATQAGTPLSSTAGEDVGSGRETPF